MAMQDGEQLDKILALADSGHDGEAVSAVRKARQLMIRDGISFGDLARAALAGLPRQGRGGFGRPRAITVADPGTAYLTGRIAELEDQLRAQDLQIGFWRRQAGDLQRRLRELAQAAPASALPPLPARFALPLGES